MEANFEVFLCMCEVSLQFLTLSNKSKGDSVCAKILYFLKNVTQIVTRKILTSVIDIVGKIKLLSWHIFLVNIWIKIFDFLQTLVVCSVGETTVTDPGFVVKGTQKARGLRSALSLHVGPGQSLGWGGGSRWRSHQMLPGIERFLKHPSGYCNYTWHIIRSLSNNEN